MRKKRTFLFDLFLFYLTGGPLIVYKYRGAIAGGYFRVQAIVDYLNRKVGRKKPLTERFFCV
jgi:hypothetical protein